MKTPEWETTARALVAVGKGILAADESSPTIEQRFNHIIMPSTEENRRDYRELLFATPEHRVRFEAMLLKPNVVLSGKECPEQVTDNLKMESKQ